MVTDPQTHPPTDRTDYSTLRRSFASAQCTDDKAHLSYNTIHIKILPNIEDDKNVSGNDCNVIESVGKITENAVNPSGPCSRRRSSLSRAEMD